MEENIKFNYSLNNNYSTEKVDNNIRVTKYSYRKVGNYYLNYHLVLITAMITSSKRINLEDLKIDFLFEESFWKEKQKRQNQPKYGKKIFPLKEWKNIRSTRNVSPM